MTHNCGNILCNGCSEPECFGNNDATHQLILPFKSCDVKKERSIISKYCNILLTVQYYIYCRKQANASFPFGWC